MKFESSAFGGCWNSVPNEGLESQSKQVNQKNRGSPRGNKNALRLKPFVIGGNSGSAGSRGNGGNGGNGSTGPKIGDGGDGGYGNNGGG